MDEAKVREILLTILTELVEDPPEYKHRTRTSSRILDSTPSIKSVSCLVSRNNSG